MPIMKRPNSKAERLHAQILQHAQKFGDDLESFELEEVPLNKTSNLLTKQSSKDHEESGSLAGFPVGR